MRCVRELGVPTALALVGALLVASCGGRDKTPADSGTTPTVVPSDPSPTATATPFTKPNPTATLALSIIAGEAPRPLFAIEANQFTTLNLDWADLLGAKSIRYNGILWSVAEPTEGERRWETMAGVEQVLASAAVRGIEPILIVRGTPAWAQAVPGWHCGPILPEKLDSFAAFMHDLVERYSGPPYNVKYWELGNEPDVAPEWVAAASPYGCWGDLEDPYFGGGYYAGVLRAVYPAVKAANPEAQLLVGGLLLDCDPRNPPSDKDCSPARFLEGILSAGGGDYFDGVSFHAYDYYGGELGQYSNANWQSGWDATGPVLIAKARYLRELLAEYGYPDKLLFNTETALLCGSSGTETPCLSDEFAETKASYIVQAYAAAATEGLSANVWYSLTGWRASGLINDALQPELAFDAFQFAAEALEGAIPKGAVHEFTGVTGYRFESGDRQLWILWSLDGEPHSIALPFELEAAYDVYGEPLDLSTGTEIGLSPLYLEGGR